MAKTKKQEQRPAAKEQRSVLRLAWERFEAGDMVEARRLAGAALAGQVAPDDLEVATQLSREMAGTPGLVVDESIASVARAIIERTKPVPRSYLFALLALGVFGLLVILAVTRYLP